MLIFFNLVMRMAAGPRSNHMERKGGLRLAAAAEHAGSIQRQRSSFGGVARIWMVQRFDAGTVPDRIGAV